MAIKLFAGKSGSSPKHKGAIKRQLTLQQVTSPFAPSLANEHYVIFNMSRLCDEPFPST
jgi:hypothetical protein